MSSAATRHRSPGVNSASKRAESLNIVAVAGAGQTSQSLALWAIGAPGSIVRTVAEWLLTGPKTEGLRPKLNPEQTPGTKRVASKHQETQ